ncbi:Negative regulator of differentiation 1 [Colletotrichum tanaceti]|uniref:Negative regulator of differentiation 1 n=1 Tax=Colletotrichum tanaceti TaxID=1306861 RepID=A0A4U6XUC4_9PEZI|nr:Negative regulator of differentiation 1 [Colletotrichum tanaceti]TKW59613.1 Negative regulator of differentiation 1 [Colletotrichum tanaceti]
MASPVGTTVSIDRTYLDTLIRRAQFNAETEVPSSHPTLTITHAEYDTLVNTVREFANLRRNLLRGGVSEETLAILTSDESNWEEDAAEQRAGAPAPGTSQNFTQRRTNQPRKPAAVAVRDPEYGHHGRSLTVHQPAKQDWADAEPDAHDTAETIVSPTEPDHGSTHHEVQLPVRPQLDRIATRTVLISNLAEGTTHADITGVVRGGQLLDIFLRAHDRSVQVSFLRGTDAKAFLEHARRHDLYIRHKRVDIRWCDRQFTLPGHVASKVGLGATRNLVVRRCDPKLTEEGIRDDLEHIHNLTVIRVVFNNGNCHINTNSVHNAMFARTCMMSRLKYKGSKVEWDVDECAQPLGATQTHRAQPHALPPKHSLGTMPNRFEILKLDGNDDDDENIPPESHLRASVDIMA